MMTQVPEETPMIAQRTSRHGRYCATKEKRQKPRGEPTVAAQRKRLIAGPVLCETYRSASVPPKLAVMGQYTELLEGCRMKSAGLPTVTEENHPERKRKTRKPPRFRARAEPMRT